MPVTFDEEKSQIPRRKKRKQEAPLVNLVIKLGLAGDIRSANRVLLIVAVVAIVLTLIIVYVFFLSPSPQPAPPSPDEIPPGVPPELFGA